MNQAGYSSIDWGSNRGNKRYDVLDGTGEGKSFHSFFLEFFFVQYFFEKVRANRTTRYNVTFQYFFYHNFINRKNGAI